MTLRLLNFDGEPMMHTILAALILLCLTAQTAVADATWRSGGTGLGADKFAAWRGTPLGVATGWAPWDNWDNMLGYMSGTNPRKLRSLSSNVSIGVGLFPKNGGNLSDCAANRYATNHRTIGSRLAANGVGNAEIRLGWEANGSWYPWTAVGRSAGDWKACFTNAARALKQGGPELRITWHMAKRGQIDVANIWPDQAPITNVGVSHYDDSQARFGTETSSGSPWGLRAWLNFARSKGKKLEMAEWGAGRSGDNPAYIESMYDFFRAAGDGLAHESYFNAGDSMLYPSTRLSRTAQRYRDLF